MGWLCFKLSKNIIDSYSKICSPPPSAFSFIFKNVRHLRILMKRQLNFILAIFCILTFEIVSVRAVEPPSGSGPVAELMDTVFYNLGVLPRDFSREIPLDSDPNINMLRLERISEKVQQEGRIPTEVYVDSNSGRIVRLEDPGLSFDRPPRISEIMLAQDVGTGKLKIVVRSAGTPLTKEAANAFRASIDLYNSTKAAGPIQPPQTTPRVPPDSLPPTSPKPLSPEAVGEDLSQKPPQGSAGHIDKPPGISTTPETSPLAAPTPKPSFWQGVKNFFRGGPKSPGSGPSSPPPPKNLGPKGPGGIMGNPLMGLAVADAAWYHIGRDLNKDLKYIFENVSLGIAPPPQDDSTPPRPDPSLEQALLEQQQLLQKERSHPFVLDPASDPRAATADDPPPPF